MQIILSEGAFLLAQLLIQNAIAAIMNQIASMTPEEVNAAIPVEQARNRSLIGEVQNH